MSEKLFYDFHIHTLLSPCGDDLMTPNNVVNMAAIKELDCIAITDHNSAGNVAACIKAAKNSELSILVVPGMELETSEEVHVVCLFESLEKTLEFEDFVNSRLPVVKNKPEIFGEQIIMDEADEEIGRKENLLLVAANIDLFEAVEKVNELGGIAIPAHIDRNSYSVLANLGFIPPDLKLNLVEISKQNDPEVFMIQNKDKMLHDLAYLQSSDAHYIENISEKERYIRVEDRTVKGIIQALKTKK